MVSDEACKGWFAVAIEANRHLSAEDVGNALLDEFERHPQFYLHVEVKVVKIREETHERLLDVQEPE